MKSQITYKENKTMMGFKGMINGKMCNSAMEFIIEARNENGEKVPKDALGVLMNSLSNSELESNLFTKKEIKALGRIEEFDKTKMYSLKAKPVAKDENCWWDTVEYNDEEEPDDEGEDFWDEDDEESFQNGCDCMRCLARRCK